MIWRYNMNIECESIQDQSFYTSGFDQATPSTRRASLQLRLGQGGPGGARLKVLHESHECWCQASPYLEISFFLMFFFPTMVQVSFPSLYLPFKRYSTWYWLVTASFLLWPWFMSILSFLHLCRSMSFHVVPFPWCLLIFVMLFIAFHTCFDTGRSRLSRA